MGNEIDLDDFREVGVIEEDGRLYSIRIDKKLTPDRENIILKKMALGKLELRGHIYIPSEEKPGA